MRKTLFISALLLPTAAMAQYYHESEDTVSSVVLFVLYVIFIVAVFLICREIVCWYWKINKSIKNQEEIIRLLKKIAGEPEEPKE